MSTQVTPEVQALESSPTPETAAPAAAPTSAAPAPAPAAPSAVVPSETPATPAWTPNFKYKAGKEEREIDEFVRGAITSPEIEKKVHELYQRAYGLDFVKKERDSFKDNFYKTRDEFEPVKKELNQLGSFVREKDFGKAFQMMGVRKEEVVNWVRQQLEYESLPPDQKARIDAFNRERDTRYKQSTEVETLRQQLETERVETLRHQMDAVMAHPRVVAAQSAYDSRMGKQGAFFEELCELGDYRFAKTGKITPPDQLAAELMKRAGLWEEPSGTPNPTPPAQTHNVVTAPPADKPTIKQFQAKPASPVKRVPKSLEDLRKMQQELSGKAIEPGRR